MTRMKRNNQHIEEYLDYYCDFKKKLPFAVLLKGKWGCGKTYFIKDYSSKNEDKKILHISLYGVHNFDGIKERIVAEILPFISKKYSEIIDRIIRTAKKIPKIKEYVPSDSDELLIDSFLKINKEYVFVFDDLERCNIEIDNLLGYINNFVEFKSRKVVLIANEEEILESERADKYRKIKEKLVGKEFAINPSEEKALDSFIKELRNKKLAEHFKDIRELLLIIFSQSKYDNLRLIQQALSNFEYFFEGFSSNATDDSELFKRMFCEFVIIFIEYKSGNIKSEEFFGDYPYFFKKISEEGRSGLFDEKKQEHFLDKYDYFKNVSWLTCFEVNVLGKILQGIDLSEKEKKEMVCKLEKLTDMNKESWQHLWDFYEQGDDNFFENLKDVQNKWDNKEYLDFFVMLHVFGLFLGFSKDGLLNKSKGDILREGMAYIEFLIDKNKLPLDLNERIGGFGWKQSAYGLGYSGMECEEWKRLLSFVDKRLEDLRGEHIKQKIDNELLPILRGEKALNNGLDLFMNSNFLHYNGEREAYFHYFDVKELSDILIKGDRLLLSLLRKVFEDRYGRMRAEIKNIEQEIPFLVKLKKQLEKEIEKIENEYKGSRTPTSLLLRKFIDEAIEPFIKKKNETTI